MDWWVERIKEKAEQCNLVALINPKEFQPIPIHSLWKYVDDSVVVISPIKLGTRWDSKQNAMVWSKKSQEDDAQEG